MNLNVVKQAFQKTIPVLTGYIVLGIGFGIVMHDAGFGLLLTFAMSTFIYAGSMQYVGINLIATSASVLTTAITTLIVNARHLFYSISMYTKYKDAGKKKPYLIFALTDETYSLLCDGDIPDGCDPNTFRLLVSLFDQCYWVLGSLIGVIAGEIIPFDTTGIDFSMTALFISSFVAQWQSSQDHFPAIVGVCTSVICLIIFGTSNFLIPSMIAMTTILLLKRGKRV